MLAPVNPVVKKQKNKRIPFSALGIAVGEVLTYRPKKSKQDKIDVIVAYTQCPISIITWLIQENARARFSSNIREKI